MPTCSWWARRAVDPSQIANTRQRNYRLAARKWMSRSLWAWDCPRSGPLRRYSDENTHSPSTAPRGPSACGPDQLYINLLASILPVRIWMKRRLTSGRMSAQMPALYTARNFQAVENAFNLGGVSNATVHQTRCDRTTAEKTSRSVR
jgi:hypothetical protein